MITDQQVTVDPVQDVAPTEPCAVIEDRHTKRPCKQPARIRMLIQCSCGSDSFGYCLRHAADTEARLTICSDCRNRVSVVAVDSL